MQTPNSINRTPIKDHVFASYITSPSLDGFLKAYKTVLNKDELPNPQSFHNWRTDETGSLYYDDYLVILYDKGGFSASPRAPHYARNRIKLIGFSL